MPYQFLTQTTHVFAKTCALVLLLGTVWVSNASAQNNEVDQIAKAHEFVVNRNWASAEALLVPLTQSQPKNPFIFYDLAQVYENTNRIELAKQVYQGLTNTLGTDPNQYTWWGFVVHRLSRCLAIAAPTVWYLFGFPASSNNA